MPPIPPITTPRTHPTPTSASPRTESLSPNPSQALSSKDTGAQDTSVISSPILSKPEIKNENPFSGSTVTSNSEYFAAISDFIYQFAAPGCEDPFSGSIVKFGKVYKDDIIGPSLPLKEALTDPFFQKFMQAFSIVMATQPANLVKIGVQGGQGILDSVLKHQSNGGFYKGASASVGLNTAARVVQLTLYSTCEEILKDAGCESAFIKITLPVLVATIGETVIQHIAEKYLSGLAGKLTPTESLKSAFNQLGLRGLQHTFARNSMAAAGFFILPEIIQEKVINQLFGEESKEVGFLAMATAFVTTFVASTPFDTAKQLHMNHADKFSKTIQVLETQLERFANAALKPHHPKNVQKRFSTQSINAGLKLDGLKTQKWPSTMQLLNTQGATTATAKITRLLRGSGPRAVVGLTIAGTLSAVKAILPNSDSTA